MSTNLHYLYLITFLFSSLLLQAQNECANATLLNLVGGNACNATHLLVDLAGSTPSSSTAPLPACGNYGAGLNDAWVRFVVPAGASQVNINGGSESSCGFFCTPAPAMQVLRGSCGALTEIACYTTPGLGARGFSNQTINVSPGETIYLRLWEASGSAIQYDLVLTPTTAVPSNDACASAAPLGTVGCNVNANGGGAPAPESCSGAGGEGTTWNTMDNSVFYTFQVTASTTQPVSITLFNVNCAGGCNDIQLALYGGGCAGVGGSDGSSPVNNSTYYGCNAGTGTVTVTATQTLSPGTYYLLVDGCSAGLPVQTSSCIFGVSSDVITVPLPLHITFFEVELKEEEETVLLKWRAEELINAQYFVLERTSNGVDFVEIETIEIEPEKLNYQYSDEDLSSAYNGYYYYRIRQINFDGASFLTDIEAVRIPLKENSIKIYPNPVLSGQIFAIGGQFEGGGILDLQIYNQLGMLVYQQDVNAGAGSLSLEINSSKLPNGVYQLSIGKGTQRISRTLVIH